MKSRDWFMVGLRLFGVWLLLDGLGEAIAGVEAHLRMTPARITPEAAYWFHMTVDLIAGLALLVCAPALCDLLNWEVVMPLRCEKCGCEIPSAPGQCPKCGTTATAQVR